MRTPVIINALVVITVFLCVIFFVTLFSSVRFEPDEMLAALAFRHNSIGEMYAHNYHYDTFRPIYPVLSFFIFGYSDKVNLYPVTVFIFYLGIAALFVFSIYKLLKEIFSLNNLDRKNKGMLTAYSILFFSGIYFLTSNRVEIFGWISASVNHLVPVGFTLASAYLLIKRARRKVDYLFLFVCAFFVAGGSEHIAPAVATIICVLTSLHFLRKKNKKEIFKANKKFFVRVLYFTGVLLIFFLLSVITPGAWFRYYATRDYLGAHNPTGDPEILQTIKMLFRPYKLAGIIFLVLSWILFKKTFVIEKLPGILLKYSFGAIACIVPIVLITSVFSYNIFSVGRIWFVFDMAVVVLISVLAIKYFSLEKVNNAAVYCSAGYIFLMAFLFDTRHIGPLRNFAVEHDKLILSLQQKNKGEIVVIEKLPEPDLVNQTPLSNDPDNHFNSLFCEFYNINAKVAMKTVNENKFQ